MTKITKYAPGQFCWADLGVADLPAAQRFYSKLLGWKSVDSPLGPGLVYSMNQVAGQDICAMHNMQEEVKEGKMKPRWLPYIAVANVDRTVKKAKAAGATICMAGHDVPNAGRMAIMLDPAGASFAVWQARAHIGTRLKAEPGTVCWHDLSTTDRPAAKKFYAKVFGWKAHDQEFSGSPYTLFKLTGKRAGLGGMWPHPLPNFGPAWYTYWLVKSCTRATTLALRLGGQVILGPITVPQTCKFSILQDPEGSAFGVLQPLI